MMSFGRWAQMSAGALVLMASVLMANPPKHQTRTYFGRPWSGPYGSPGGVGHGGGMHGQNPWTGKIFGFRCCKTCATVEEDYQRQLAVAQARAQVIVNRVQPKHFCGNLSSCGSCGCPAGPGCVQGICGLLCGKCMAAGAGCANGNCGGMHGGGFGGGYEGAGGFGPGGGGFAGGGNGAALPGMNREDAVRYIEGFQYYPPQQIIRSPRDFFMFDVKYGVGR